jgi:hypothetical protein
VDHLSIRSTPDCYKEFKIGSQLHKRYSQKTLDVIREALEKESAEDIWTKCHPKKIKPWAVLLCRFVTLKLRLGDGERLWDELLILRGKRNRHEFRGPTFGIVHL